MSDAGAAMTVFLWKHKLSYIAVPKVACTSVKAMLFEVENGRPFQRCVANGKVFHVHLYYPTLQFTDLPRARIADHARFALVRDPIGRFLSSLFQPGAASPRIVGAEGG